MELYKYQGAGNDFIIADNREGLLSFTPAEIAQLCDRRYGIGADGLMLLETAEGYDFKMVYYNSDGSGGMMCGNGGRCIVAFADFCGIKSYNFIAADGPHTSTILERNGKEFIVKLKMKDVDKIKYYDTPALQGCFLDTGTRHFVMPVCDLEQIDVVSAGRPIRYDQEFAPLGTNVNFIMSKDNILNVRTYEKGVEAETYACGTGITASAIVFWHIQNDQLIAKSSPMPNHVHIGVQAVRDKLAVDFTPTPTGATDVFLIGPATYVAKIII